MTFLIDDFPNLIHEFGGSILLRHHRARVKPTPRVTSTYQSSHVFHITVSESADSSRPRPASPDLVFPPPPLAPPVPGGAEDEREERSESYYANDNDFFSFLHCASIIHKCYYNKPKMVDKILELLVPPDIDVSI